MEYTQINIFKNKKLSDRKAFTDLVELKQITTLDKKEIVSILLLCSRFPDYTVTKEIADIILGNRKNVSTN